MRLRNLVLVVLLSVLAPSVMAQGSATAVGGNAQTSTTTAALAAFLGKWTGKWLSDGRSRASGDLQMELFAASPDRVTGQVTFATSATPPCSPEWQKFSGNNSGGKVSAQVDLKGRCGKVDVVFWLDPTEKNVLTGTYNGEYPDKGSIRLTRQ